MKYSIDTCALLDGWQRYYPKDVFPGLWKNLAGLIRNGGLCASEEVKFELAKKNDALYAWGNKFDDLYVPLDDSIQRVVSEILKEHPRLIDTRKNRSGADPFVIALASVHKCAVVTGEHKSGSLTRPKIPDVCDAMEVKSLSFLELIRSEGWVFSS